MSYDNETWDNITFPTEIGETKQDLELHLSQILKFIADKKPSFDDVEAMFDTTNWEDFLSVYPHLYTWKDEILKAVKL